MPALVPHRHRLPPSALRTSSTLALGCERTNAVAAVTNPGVQKPHCWASCFTKAFWTSFILSGVPMPSTVVISWPSASTASIEQEYTGRPSTSTVQAPQVPRSQTFFGPVGSSRLRKASSRVTRGSSVSLRLLPLTLSVRGNSPGPRTLGSWAPSASGLTAERTPAAAVPTPMPLRNPRRETPEPLEEDFLSAMTFFLNPRARLADQFARQRSGRRKLDCVKPF